jgi:Fur family ferric uptake transcriptional regulator
MVARKPPQSPLLCQLRAHGLRLTHQRAVIGEVLQSAGKHLDAAEVCRRARRRLPGLHLATVYRALHSLKKRGIIDELDLMHVRGTGHYYETHKEKDHLHFTCERCGGVVEVAVPQLERLKAQIEASHGVSVRVARLELGGLCRACALRRKKGTLSVESKVCG